MTWDLGLRGLAYLGAMSLAFGVVAGLLVGGGTARRLWGAGIATAACYAVGLITSEGLFGWATEEELQPNIDGLSRDEVLLSSFLTTLVVVLVMRYVAHRTGAARPTEGRHARHARHARHPRHGRHAGHA